jgi:hypothetical protein
MIRQIIGYQAETTMNERRPESIPRQSESGIRNSHDFS